MRIRRERLDSNIRISKLEIALSEAIDQIGDEYTYVEIITSLQNHAARWANYARNEECPSIEKEDDGDEGNP